MYASLVPTISVRLRFTAAILTLSVLLSPAVPAWGTPEAPKSVRIGVLAKRGPQRCLAKWGPTAEYLTSEIPGSSFTIVPLGFHEIYPTVERGELDFIVVNPSLYVGLERLYGASRILTLKNLRLGRVYTVYGGVIFCRADRKDIESLSDLAGKSFMAVEQTSLGGWHAAWLELKKHGIDPHRDFADLRFGGTHDTVVYAVRDGKVDAGTVQTDTLERMVEEGRIRLEEFRVTRQKHRDTVEMPFLRSTRLYPEWPLAKVRHTSDELAEKVTAALLRMSADTQAARAARCAGWTIPHNYQPVHECLKTLRVAPYADYGKVTLRDVLRHYWPWLLGAVVAAVLILLSAAYVVRLNRRLREAVAEQRNELVERKQAGEALRESEERLRTLIDSSTESFHLVDMELNVIVINRIAVETLKAEGIGIKSKDDVLGRNLVDIYPFLNTEKWSNRFSQVRQTGESVSVEDKAVHKKLGDSYFSAQVFRVGERYIGITATDTTGRKKADEERERLLLDLGERVKELNCLYAISRLAEQPDVTAEQILQGTVEVIPSSWQYPEVTTARITLQNRVYSTANFRESRWRQTSEIVVHGEPIGSVEVYYLEEKPASDEGPFLKEERSLIDAIAERLGKTVQRIRLEEERATLKEQLHQARKLEAVAQLAGGVAHDFNNLLAAIFGYTSLARTLLPEGHKAIKWLNGVEQAAEQAAGVTNSLLTFSRKTVTKKGPVELRGLVEKSIHLLRRVLPSAIEVVTDAAGDTPVWVRADNTQLQQVVLNLAINARDAMPEGGTLQISVSPAPADVSGATASAGSLDTRCQGPVARLVVSDTGVGMSPEVQKSVFEPFFTTKPQDQGTGLGLAILHGIVKDHGGRIEVQSEVGRGTTFTVVLPCLEEDVVSHTAKPSLAASRGHGELVLVAEDSLHVRSIMASALESLHYEVMEATDGPSLLEHFERHGPRVRLLVIDVDLPKRSGLDCLQDIRAGGVRTPAIVITAEVDADLEEKLDGDSILLRKPFQISDLGARVGSILGARRRGEDPA